MEVYLGVDPHGLKRGSECFDIPPHSPPLQPRSSSVEYLSDYAQSSSCPVSYSHFNLQKTSPPWLSYLVELFASTNQHHLLDRQRSTIISDLEPTQNTSGAGTPTDTDSINSEIPAYADTADLLKLQLRDIMARKKAVQSSPQQPNSSFHMRTRGCAKVERSSQSETHTLSPPPTQVSSTRATTPELVFQTSITSDSSLSSLPSSIGDTPPGLVFDDHNEYQGKDNNEGLVTKSMRKRRQSLVSDSPASKKAKVDYRDNDSVQIQSTDTSNISSFATPYGKRRSSRLEIDEEIGIIEIANPIVTPRRVTRSSTSSPSKTSVQQVATPRKTVVKEQSNLAKNKTNKAHSGLPTEHSSSVEIDARTHSQPGSQRTASATGSPRKPARGGSNGRGRGGGNTNGGGRWRGRNKGKGNQGDSPEPPPRKRLLNQEDRAAIAILKARQQELKRFFSIVGGHQVDILDHISGRDLTKMIRKAKTHRQVPEYENVVQDLNDFKDDTIDYIRRRYDFQIQQETERMVKERELIEEQFRTRCRNAQEEHQQGAQGDMILLRRAFEAAKDETRTESGSEVDYLPRYHELPEADAQVRGYVSSKIIDEKPFKHSLSSYDDQAKQEVIDEDFIAPMIKALEEKNRRWREEQDRKRTQNMAALCAEAEDQLEKINGPSPSNQNLPAEQNAYALSALADVAELVVPAQLRPLNYMFVPLTHNDQSSKHIPSFGMTTGETPASIQVRSPSVPLPPPPPGPTLPPLSQTPSVQPTKPQHPPTNTVQSPRVLSPAVNPIPIQSPPKQIVTQPQLNGHIPKLTPLPPPGKVAIAPATPSVLSQGRGQTLAPAPPKINLQNPGTNTIRRHSRPSSTSGGQSGPQQFIFQPPQQPMQHQSAPGPNSSNQFVPSINTSSQVSHQTKLPVTFVNQTIASRRASAAAAASAANANGHGGNKGGQRMLLPKV